MNKLEEAMENLRKAHPEPMELDASGKRAVIFVIAVYIILVIINCYNTNKVVREATAYVDDANRKLEEQYKYLQNVSTYFEEYNELMQNYFQKENEVYEETQKMMDNVMKILDYE